MPEPEGWLDAHLSTPYPGIRSTLEELHQLLDTRGDPEARSRGAAMTPTELAEHLDDELTTIIDENTNESS